MRAAKTGNIENVKILLKYGADSFNNGKDTFHDESFKTAADHAFEAKYFEIAFLLNPDETLHKLRKEFRLKCEADVRIRYEGNTEQKGKEETVFQVLLKEIASDDNRLTPVARARSSFTSSSSSKNALKHKNHNLGSDINKNNTTKKKWLYKNEVVCELERYAESECQQAAFDYYMARPEQFGHLAKIAAVDPITFEIFVGILANVRIKNVAMFFSDILSKLYSGLKEDTNNDNALLWRVVLLWRALYLCKDCNIPSANHFFDDELERLKKG